MIKYLKLMLLLALSFLFFSCDEEEILPEETYIYPLALGNTWIYNGSLTLEFYEDTLSYLNMTATSRDTVTVDSLLSINNFSHDMYIFKTAGTQHGFDGDSSSYASDYNYISNESYGLLHHGYQNSGGPIIQPGPSDPAASNIKLEIKGESFLLTDLINIINHGPDLGLIIWEAAPLISIKYPVVLNDQWSYRNYGNPWKMDRRVSEKNDNGFTITTLYDMDEDSLLDSLIHLTQTYTANGLSSVTTIIDSLHYLNIGKARLITTHNLIDHLLNE